MTLHWVEGFETHATSTYLGRKYAAAGGTLSAATGRLFGNAITINGAAGQFTTPSFGVQNTWIIGFGFKVTTSVLGSPTVTIMSGATEQCSISIVSSGAGYVWRIRRGSTTIATSATVRSLATWYYVELKVTVRDGTDGVYELRVDETADISGSGVNLANTGADGADVFQFSATSSNTAWDDIYICDDQGSINNNFQGDSAVRGILPNGDGASTALTPSTGTSHFALVDDTATAPTPDTDYNRAVNVGDRDLYAYENLTGQLNGPIVGVMVTSDMRMETTGTGQMKVVVRQGGVNYDQATHTVNGTGVRAYTQIIENSPDDAAPWEVADLDNAQIGVEKVS
jgi:hypothetical protein